MRLIENYKTETFGIMHKYDFKDLCDSSVTK